MRSLRFALPLCAYLLLAAGSHLALADGDPEPVYLANAPTLDEAIENIPEPGPERKFRWSTFDLSIGASFLSNFTTEVRVDQKSFPIGATLRLEDDLGFDSNGFIARTDMYYRFSRRHRIDFSYFYITRNSELQTDQEYQWGDVTIPKTRVEFAFNTQVFKLSYRYNFIARKDWALGAGLGVHWMRIKTGFKIKTKPSDGSSGLDVDDGETLRAEVPLPVLGFYGVFAFSENWRVFSNLEFLRADIGPIDGLLADYRLGIEWDVVGPVGLSLYYNSFLLDVEVNEGDWQAQVSYGYQGLILAVRVFF